MPKKIKLSDTHLLFDIAEERIKELEMLIREKQISMEKAPPGDLHIVNRGNQVQFYLRLQACEKSGQYISKKNKPFIKSMMQKKYDSQVLKAAIRERKALRLFLSRCPAPDEIRILYSHLHPALKQYIIPADMSDEDYAVIWKAEEYKGKDVDGVTTQFFTDNGERVRSKSEVLIANTLSKYKVPYKYEYPVRLKNGMIIYVDFLALNVHTREQFFWEHLGMMDHPEYAAKAIAKVEGYEETGIYQGKNLILTFETSGQPLKTKAIERMIQRYLL
ncbi:MAG: hypothetical protein IJ061_10170 [Lachnospiraceae bacterium]|nr:hypothetical protein [Lachnospiraceae bacterium]